MGRSEDEPALRDAVLLTAVGDDPGPAGKVFLATKRLSTRKPAFSSKAVAELADLLGLAWDDRLTAAVDHADDALQSGRPAPFAAADLVTAIHAVRPHSSLGYQTPAAFAGLLAATGNPVAQPAPQGVTETDEALSAAG